MIKLVKNDMTRIRFTLRKDDDIVFYNVPIQVLQKYVQRAYPDVYGQRKITTLLMEKGYTYTSKIRQDDGTYKIGTRSKNS